MVLVREPHGRWAVRADREENRLYLNLSVLDLEDTDDPAVRDVILDVGASVLFHLRAHVGAPDEALTASALAASDRPLKFASALTARGRRRLSTAGADQSFVTHRSSASSCVPSCMGTGHCASDP